MKLCFPSQEFDDAVAAVCHGSVSDEEAVALNELLRRDPAARDEYLLRIELHARLASDPDLFVVVAPQPDEPAPANDISSYPGNILPLRPSHFGRRQVITAVTALAACVAVLAGGWWGWREWRHGDRKGATSKAVAMLNGVVDAQWSSRAEAPRAGAPLDPGWLRLKSGLAQVVFCLLYTSD